MLNQKAVFLGWRVHTVPLRPLHTWKNAAPRARAVLCNAALGVDAVGIMSCEITWRGSLTFADDGHRTQNPASSSQQIGVGAPVRTLRLAGLRRDDGTFKVRVLFWGPVARQQILRRYVPFAMSAVLAQQNDPGVRLKSTREIDS